VLRVPPILEEREHTRPCSDLAPECVEIATQLAVAPEEISDHASMGLVDHQSLVAGVLRAIRQPPEAIHNDVPEGELAAVGAAPQRELRPRWQHPALDVFGRVLGGSLGG